MRGSATIWFEPEGRKIDTEFGVTILEASREAGVYIRSECGGKGICGKCRVIVKEQRYLNDLMHSEKKHLTNYEIGLGYRLACCAVVKGPVVVEVPEESRVGVQRIQILGFERAVRLSPCVKKIFVRLSKPTLADIKPDVERLLDYLNEIHSLSGLEVDYHVLKSLPAILRKANWDITVSIWNNKEIIAVEEGDTSNVSYGFAVDIGTSKIAGYLVNLTTGQVVSAGFVENPQLVLGEDIISRLNYAMKRKSGLKELQKLAVEGVKSALIDACKEAGVNPNNVYEITLVGNTAMLHFFLAIHPNYLALSPFVPAVKRSLDIKARIFNLGINPHGYIHILPIIAGFVGADAVADVLATGIHETDDLSLLVDIGTNTEIFVGNSEDLLSCSCASGPAFEGMHIKHGMKAITGAIERVNITSDFEVEYVTIGDTKPSGLCGSAMVDAVAAMFKRGLIDNKGRFNWQVETRRLKKEENEAEFVIAWGHETATGKEITVTQKDIREIQLAKAAIYAGCSVIMRRKNVSWKDLDRVFVAGAFGNSINLENAIVLGLIPDVPLEKVKFVGNTALAGAKMALLSEDARREADVISKKVRYLELAADPTFDDEFFKATFIPHADLNRFPSVGSILRDSTGKVFKQS